MSRLNTKASNPNRTHEGAPAYPKLTDEQMLRRSVMSCMLWEGEFYESGETIANRIAQYAAKVNPAVLADIALDARSNGNLRHVPLLLLCELAKRNFAGTEQYVYDTIQRPDEITELVAVYWRDGKKPLPAAFKRGLARSFSSFNEYSLAKYDRDGKIKLRDVMKLVRPKPPSEEKNVLYKKVIDRTLETPDTWEVALSGGADKKETFTRLLKEGKLGYLALLRNLRNMATAGVDPKLVNDAIRARKGGAERVLPFRYVAAARAAPQYERALDEALQTTIRAMPKLDGQTVVLVDVSGSMNHRLSAKSDMTRLDAACTLASMVDGDVRVFSFSNRIVEVPHRLGMAGVDAIIESQPRASTYLGEALDHLAALGDMRRLIVITDEQSHDIVNRPKNFDITYLINVASAKNGVGYGDWVHIDGFSESVLRYIFALEPTLGPA